MTDFVSAYKKCFHNTLEKSASTKLARVATAVKMYRRAMQALRSGQNLYHGTKPQHVKSIASSGVINPHGGTHGTGAYFWRGKPRSTYMRWPEYPGLWTRRAGTKMGPTPFDPRPAGTYRNPGITSDRPFMEISSTPVKLAPGKQTTISATPKGLREAREGIKANRFRQMDTRIFHRAEADRQMQVMDKLHGSDNFVAPTKRDLVRILQGKTPTPRVGMTRKQPKTPYELNQFYGSYDKNVGRQPWMKENFTPAMQRKGLSPYDYF